VWGAGELRGGGLASIARGPLPSQFGIWQGIRRGGCFGGCLVSAVLAAWYALVMV
jgi:hypothetical protein